jgi:hypothetical protein
MPTATAPTRPAGPEEEQSPAVLAAPAAAKPLAICYSPEIESPITLAAVSGGSFVVSFPSDGTRLVLDPGLNLSVDRDLWEKAQGLSAVADMLAQRVIDVIEVEVDTVYTKESTEKVVNIAKTEQASALRLVHLTRDLALLRNWEDKTGDKPTLQSAIRRRIKALEAGEG